MSKASGTSLLIDSAVGPSNHFQLLIGIHTLSVTADSWGSAALESSSVGDNNWRPVKDSNGDAIVFTSDDDVVVVGNRDYRLNTITLTDDITFSHARSA